MCYKVFIPQCRKSQRCSLFETSTFYSVHFVYVPVNNSQSTDVIPRSEQKSIKSRSSLEATLVNMQAMIGNKH